VESVIELFFNAREHTVIEEEWTNTKASITCAIVEQLNMVEESANQEAFSSMFYQTLTTGQMTWATTFLKLLAGIRYESPDHTREAPADHWSIGHGHCV
jgi:hypothetical protein